MADGSAAARVCYIFHYLFLSFSSSLFSKPPPILLYVLRLGKRGCRTCFPMSRTEKGGTASAEAPTLSPELITWPDALWVLSEYWSEWMSDCQPGAHVPWLLSQKSAGRLDLLLSLACAGRV